MELRYFRLVSFWICFFLKTFCQQDHNLTTENFLADDHLKIKDFSKWEYIFLAKLEDKKNLQMIFLLSNF